MHHCVATYADRVREGACYVFSVRQSGERVATVSLVRDGARVLIEQVRGPCNSTPTTAIMTAVRQWLRTRPAPAIQPRDQQSEGLERISRAIRAAEDDRDPLLRNRNTMADDLATIRNALTERAGDLARYLIGEPTAASKRELRWGRHGSFSVVLTGKNAGVWRDHETNDAGDMLALIMRERRCDFANSLKFGREFVGNHSVRPCYRSQPRRASLQTRPKLRGGSGVRVSIHASARSSDISHHAICRCRMNSQTTCCAITATSHSNAGRRGWSR